MSDRGDIFAEAHEGHPAFEPVSMQTKITNLDPGDVFVLDGEEYEFISAGRVSILLDMVPVRMRRFGGLRERVRHFKSDTIVELRA